MKKLDLNNLDLLEAASILKVLGHPIRILIIELLFDSKRMTVSEIFKALNIEQAIASHHLNTLKNKQVLVSERVGKNSYYSVADTKLTEMILILRGE
jgi:DNA-binding transcriptional ArsR family regulator